MKLLQKYTGLIGLFLMLFAASSCGDDPQPDPAPPPQPKDPHELITQQWKVASVTKGGETIISNSFTIVFKADKTYEFETLEIPGFPARGSWEHIASGNIIRLDGETDLDIIGQLTETSFVFEYTYTNHKMGEVKVRFTLA